MDFSEWTEQAFAAYLGGFTDGEGNIAVALKWGGVRVTLANCVLPVLEGIRRRLGFGAIRSQQQKPHWRRRYILVFDDALECERFTQLVYPYLQIKRPEATALLARCRDWHAAIAQMNERNRLIREAIAAGEKQTDIAARFGLSRQTISRIKLGHTWPSEQPKNMRGVGTMQGKVRWIYMPPPEPA